MSNTSAAVTFVWPGDLHLETPDRENYRVAKWMVDDVTKRVKPDFVQFAGDNAQQATTAQFEMFTDLRKKLTAPSYALVGDHDAHHDPHANAYRLHCGEPYGAFSVNGYRFIRLNTMEFRPLGLTTEQILWFRYEADLAVSRGEKIVRSEPRSFILRSWLVSIDSRSSSSEMVRSESRGAAAGSLMPAIWRLRQFSSALGAVV